MDENDVIMLTFGELVEVFKVWRQVNIDNPDTIESIEDEEIEQKCARYFVNLHWELFGGGK